MDRINGAGHVGHMFVMEDPLTNRPPTEVTHNWLNTIQEELVQVATMMGDPLNPESTDQLKTAIQAYVASLVAPPKGYMHVRDEKAPGTNGGGASANTTAQRELNTVVTNTIVGASLYENVMLLPAGTFIFSCRVPGFRVNQFRAHLFNVTTNEVGILGSSENANSNTATDPQQSSSIVCGLLTFSEPTQIDLRMYTQQGFSGSGFGRFVDDAVGNEVFSSVEILEV